MANKAALVLMQLMSLIIGNTRCKEVQIYDITKGTARLYMKNETKVGTKKQPNPHPPSD